MTPEDLAVWISRNRKQLKRTDQWVCDCSSSTDPLAVAYVRADEHLLLWVRTGQGVDQSGAVLKPPARAFDLTTQVRQGTQLDGAVGECRRCRRGLLFLLTPDGGMRTTVLGSPTRTQIVE